MRLLERFAVWLGAVLERLVMLSAEYRPAAKQVEEVVVVDVKKIKPGTKSTCKMCNQPIEYIGPYWKHTGDWQPRHPATPSDSEESTGEQTRHVREL